MGAIDDRGCSSASFGKPRSAIAGAAYFSSVFFDFACLRRPIVFYAFDLESYRDELRGFYLDYETELPGPIVTTEKELYAALQSLPAVMADYGDRYSEFIERFSPRDDGHAARRLVDEMLARGPKPQRGTVRRLGRAGRRIQRKLRG